MYLLHNYNHTVRYSSFFNFNMANTIKSKMGNDKVLGLGLKKRSIAQVRDRCERIYIVSVKTFTNTTHK